MWKPFFCKDLKRVIFDVDADFLCKIIPVLPDRFGSGRTLAFLSGQDRPAIDSDGPSEFRSGGGLCHDGLQVVECAGDAGIQGRQQCTVVIVDRQNFCRRPSAGWPRSRNNPR